MKRSITHKEEQAIRLVHHDFKGLTVVEAARVMQVQPRQVRKLLKSAKEKAPQLFPILSPRRRVVLLGWQNKASKKTIMEGNGLSAKEVELDITFLRKHGFIFDAPKTIAYSPGMDGDIREKF